MLNEDIKFLKELQNELKTQENDCQAAPRFWVIMDHEYQNTERGYHDRVAVYDSDNGESYELEEYVKVLKDEENEFLADEIEDLEEILKHTYSRESSLIEWVEENCNGIAIYYEKEVSVIKQNTMFLTKQEAKDHLKANSHHYSNKAHTYAMTAWRAPKVAKLLSVLENINWDAK